MRISQFPMKISAAFKEDATEIFVGDGLCGFGGNPPRPSEKQISRAFKENATAIFDGYSQAGFGTNPLSPFPRNIPIAFKEIATEIPPRKWAKPKTIRLSSMGIE